MPDFDGWGVRTVECSKGHRSKRVIPLDTRERLTYCIECRTARLLKEVRPQPTTNDETRG